MNWAIGDIQGCYDNFQRLLKKIEFNPKSDKLWLVGDLVNRGPKSLEVLEYLYDIQESCNIVLGNHDVSLIATYYGLKKPNENTLPVLESKNADKLINWLRSLPFIHIDYDLGYIMAHAGIAPQFELGSAIYYNKLLTKELSGKNAREWLEKILKKKATKFHPKADIIEEERYALGSFISMRYCYVDGTLDFKQKGSPKELKRDDLYPWFDCPNRKKLELKVVFGHWSTLGFLNREDIVALDTGCVWKKSLSAFSLENSKLVQIPC